MLEGGNAVLWRPDAAWLRAKGSVGTQSGRWTAGSLLCASNFPTNRKPPGCLKYRQLLCCYPNKQELTSPLSFLSHSRVSLATVLDELRGLTSSREPILSHPKFVSLRVMWHRFPWQPGWRAVWVSLWSGEHTTHASEQPWNQGGNADISSLSRNKAVMRSFLKRLLPLQIEHRF